ncbi:hypothetical protein PIB30_057639 [Stylosanthes scabra]|uniref:Uncharacterized protein n=1 Tax=Stylosanthes scabra TaxID=79078 RepID=A0ABU6VI75_9FABA|nr:hypothetical protein [Stylosanthes scabra]
MHVADFTRRRSSLPRPPPSSRRPESNEPSLATVRSRTGLHALSEGPLPTSCFSLQKIQQPLDLVLSSTAQILTRVET